MSQFSHLYQNHRWRKLRAAQLEREPLCSYCKRQGKVTVATVCDHITPHRGDLAIFWQPGNFQSLCALHHNAAKQREENIGMQIGGDTDGNPIDPKHHWNQ